MTIACRGRSARQTPGSMIQCHSAHPEGQRERPVEVPATLLPTREVPVGKVPIPSRGEVRREEDEEKGPRHHGCADCCRSTNSSADAVDLGPAAALSCRECGRAFRARSRSSPARSVSGRSKSRTTCRPATPRSCRKRIEAGPNNIWRYAPLLPVPADVADKPNINPGFTKLVKADNLARELGVTGGLYVKDDSGNPTHSFKDRVVADRRRGRPRLRLHHPLLLLHRQPRRRRRRRRRPRRLPLLRVHPARPGAGQGRHGRGVRR